MTRGRSRGLDQFFGERAAVDFWVALEDLGIEIEVEIYADIYLELDRFKDNLPSFTKSLTAAFEILIRAPGVARGGDRRDEFGEELRRPFLESPYREVHEGLFRLAEQFRYVCVQGQRDYGVRVAHSKHQSGVSLVRSRESDLLVIVGRR